MTLSASSISALAREIHFQLQFQRDYPGLADYFCGYCIAELISDLGGLAGAW